MELEITSPKYGKFIVYYDDADHDLVRKYKWRPVIRKDGRAYAATSIYLKEKQNNKVLLMHVLIMGKPGIDHKDRNGLNNSRTNLRFSTQSQNTKNQSLKKTNKIGFKGVSFDKAKGKYSCHLTNEYKHIFGGYFNNPVEAAKKYNELAVKYHGEYACLNVISKEDEEIYSHIKGRYQKPKSNNTTGFRGVRKYAHGLCKREYYSQITVSGKVIHLGSFYTKEEAAIAYNSAALKHYGDNALLNKI